MDGRRALRAASTPLFPSPWPPLIFLAVGCCDSTPLPARSTFFAFILTIRAPGVATAALFYLSSPAGPTKSFFAHFLSTYVEFKDVL